MCSVDAQSGCNEADQTAHTVCQYKGNDACDCFADLPEVKVKLHSFVKPPKLGHKVHGETRTPFSDQFVWVKSSPLGSGAFGCVYRCRSIYDDAYYFAVKEIPIGAEPGGVADVMREINALHRLEGTCHVVQLHAFFRSADTAWLLLQLVPGTSLRELVPALGRLRREDREAIVKRVAVELFEALAAAHGMGVAHGDIKPDNIYVDLRDCHRMSHLLDWGLAVQYKPGTKEVVLKGTLEYLAPEVIDGWVAQSRDGAARPVAPGRADNWSLATVLLEALTQRALFHVGFWRLTTLQQAKGIRKLQRNWAARSKCWDKLEKEVAGLPDDARAFFQALLVTNPDERLSAAQALNHPYLGSHSESKGSDIPCGQSCDKLHCKAP